MLEYFMEFELDVQKANHMFESALDMFALASIEIAQQNKFGIIEESSTAQDMIVMEAKKFTESIKQFFTNIVETFHKLIQNITLKFQTEVTKRQVNKRLKELKAALAEHRTAGIKDEKIKVFDTQKYIDNYTKYINFYTTEVKKLYNTKYDNLDQYQQALKKFYDDVDKKYEECQLNTEEAFIIDSYINKAVALTEHEINFTINTLNAQAKYSEEIWKYLREKALTTDEATMISDMRKIASKISIESSKTTKKIVESPLQKISKLFSKLGGKKDSSESSDNKEE